MIKPDRQLLRDILEEVEGYQSATVEQLESSRSRLAASVEGLRRWLETRAGTCWLQESVEEFHLRHRFPVRVKPGDLPETDLVRIHLIAEEMSELALAIARRDRAGIADALGDLLYVVVGAAVTYDIPLAAVFEEVHRSNMTKATRQEDDTRLRQKGDGFQPPNIRGVLERYT